MPKAESNDGGSFLRLQKNDPEFIKEFIESLEITANNLDSLKKAILKMPPDLKNKLFDGIDLPLNK